MDHPHPLKVRTPQARDLEKVAEGFLLEQLENAQKKSWDVLYQIKNELKEGMTETEARKRCLEIFQDHGVRKHWHRPYVRFGPGTLLNFHHPDQNEHRLQENDPIYFDLGPVWPDPETGLEYEGDVGEGFAFGKNFEFERLKDFSHKLFNHCQEIWKNQKTSGQELYELAKKYCEGSTYQLNSEVAGHRVSDFPHVKYTKERLDHIEFIPKRGLWIFEIHVLDQENQMGYFMENTLGERFENNLP